MNTIGTSTSSTGSTNSEIKSSSLLCMELFESNNVATYSNIFAFLTPKELGIIRLLNKYFNGLLNDTTKENNKKLWLFLIECHFTRDTYKKCKNILRENEEDFLTVTYEFHRLYQNALTLYQLLYYSRHHMCILCRKVTMDHLVIRRDISFFYCNSCFDTELCNYKRAKNEYYMSNLELNTYFRADYCRVIERNEIERYFDTLFEPGELERRRKKKESRSLIQLAKRNTEEISYRKELKKALINIGMKGEEEKLLSKRPQYLFSSNKNDVESNAEDIIRELKREEEMIEYFKQIMKEMLADGEQFVIRSHVKDRIRNLAETYILGKIEANDAENLQIAKKDVKNYALGLIGIQNKLPGKSNKTFVQNDQLIKRVSNSKFDLEKIQKLYRTPFIFAPLTSVLNERTAKNIVEMASREVMLIEELKKNNLNFMYLDIPKSVDDWIEYGRESFYSVVNILIRHNKSLFQKSILPARCVMELKPIDKINIFLHVTDQLLENEEILTGTKKSEANRSEYESDSSENEDEMSEENDSHSNSDNNSNGEEDNNNNNNNDREHDLQSNHKKNKDNNKESTSASSSSKPMVSKHLINEMKSIKNFYDSLVPFVRDCTGNTGIIEDTWHSKVASELADKMFSLVFKCFSPSVEKITFDYVYDNFITVPGTFGKPYSYQIPMQKTQVKQKKKREYEEYVSHASMTKEEIEQSIARTKPQRKRRKFAS